MKTFVITHSYVGDGASQMLLGAASHWTKQLGWQVDAVTVPHMTAEARQALAGSGMTEIQRASFAAGYDFALINCLKNIHFTDFIHPHLPIVLWAHEAETSLKSGVTPEQWKNWFSKVSLVIFQTEWQLRLFKKYLPDNIRVAVIPNGIPPVGVAANDKAARDDTFRIACLGKLTPLKAQADLIRAAAGLSSKYPLHCELIGDTEHLAHLHPVARKALDRHPDLFTLSGYLPRQLALEAVAKADLFCFPSMSESFGLAPLEAAALGVPVVLADLGPYKAIGWKSGENCLMFPAGDRKKLASALEAAIKDIQLRNRIAENGKELADRYSMGPFLRGISELIANADLKVV